MAKQSKTEKMEHQLVEYREYVCYAFNAAHERHCSYNMIINSLHGIMGKAYERKNEEVAFEARQKLHQIIQTLEVLRRDEWRIACEGMERIENEEED